jgi:fructokinase
MHIMFGAIEAGGTKFVCGVGSGPEDLETIQFQTTTPQDTIAAAIGFLRERTKGKLKAVGIGSFGPLDLHRDSPTWGRITTTPKAGWQDVDLAGEVERALGVPVGFDTDVNGAMLGEARWGAAQGLEDAVYLTVGTGIGGGALAGGRLMHGLLHPEMGHIRVPHDLTSDPFEGCCPFHGDCLEGLASGPAMRERWGAPAEAMALDHPAWTLEARYLALALATWVCTLSPRRFVLGGGIMRQSLLFPLVRAELGRLLNGYIRVPALFEGLDQYVVPPGLGDRSGVLGALILAEQAWHENNLSSR